jgi:hypothetical protein
MDITNMPKRELIPLFHCLEWIHFWWENQTSDHYEDMPDWQNQEWCEEFAGTWYSMEPGKNDPELVTYSAGVYTGRICEDEAIEDTRKRFTTEELRKIIQKDYDSFYQMTDGLNADDFLPYGWV